MRPPTPASWPGATEGSRTRRARRRRPGNSFRTCPTAVVLVSRLHRDGWLAAQRLEGRDHTEDLLIGEADWRHVDGRHRRGKSRDDVGRWLVQRFDEVVDLALPRLSGARACPDSREIGEPKRPGLPDRVARQTESLAFHDLAADL